MIIESKIRGESNNRTVRQRFLAGRQNSADKTTYSEVNWRGGGGSRHGGNGWRLC